MKTNPKDVESFMESHGFEQTMLGNYSGHEWMLDGDQATYWYEQTQVAVRAARIDELEMIIPMAGKRLIQGGIINVSDLGGGDPTAIDVSIPKTRLAALKAPDTKLTDKENA